jgi:transposase
VARAYIQQFALITELVGSARRSLLHSASKNPAYGLLQTIPFIGEIRAATLVGIIGTIARFRTRRQLWSYFGLGVIQRVSSEYKVENGQVVKGLSKRGVRRSSSGQPILRNVVGDISAHASGGRGELRAIFERHIARGKNRAVARLSLARKVVSIVLAVWRSGQPYDARKVKLRRRRFGASIHSAAQPRAIRAEATTKRMPPRRISRM